MTDKELLELAAKAAGMDDWRWNEYSQCHCHYNAKMSCWYHDSFGDRIEWTPLADDGDALRLHAYGYQTLGTDYTELFEQFLHEELLKNPSYAVTCFRRAIVRAAAEMGKGMQHA